MMLPLETLKAIAPNRLSWLPGLVLTGETPALVSYVEAGPGLVPSLLKLLRVTNQGIAPRGLYRRLPVMGGVVRAVVRNGRTAVACCVSDHDPEGNYVARYAVHPNYSDEPYDLHLLYLAALELPEVPTYVWVRETDVARQLRLKALDFRADRCDRDRIRFAHAPLGRRTGEPESPSRAESPPAADG